MGTPLIIVESPTKAKTISRFLGKKYRVTSSFGHVRDLPKSKMGIDTTGSFLPTYTVPIKAKKVVTDLKKMAKTADKVYFATDEDREGEAISWHLAQLLGVPEEKAARITFHEITPEAIKHALANPRRIDDNLVDAQQARRVLDRLVGYELSPLLWHKIRRGLSAGRVQSVAVRFIVDREREIEKFVSEEYWTINAIFTTPTGEEIEASLHKVDGETLEKFAFRAKAAAEATVIAMRAGAWKIAAIEKKEVHRAPAAPYTTSTLQQDANRKLHMSAKQAMMIAQQLYEGVELPGEGSVGLITYMRTDAVNLAVSFVDAAREYILETFGKDALPTEVRKYTAKSKLAQEAHEAIRPTDARRTPDSIKDALSDSQYKLYDAIWRRAVGCQMTDAHFEQMGMDVVSGTFSCRASGNRLLSPGWLALAKETEKDRLLPVITEGEKVDLKDVKPEQHFTEPPARFSDASLVKILEEHGVGRPSTYAPTISTVIDRGYVERIENRRLKPTEIAFLVNDFLVEHFPTIVDFEFTAKMEDDLDGIAEGNNPWVPVVKMFYIPFHETIEQKEKTVSKKALTEEATDILCDKCGQPMVIKMGRFGKFLACTGYPECKNTKPLAKDGTVKEPVLTDEKCEKCGKPMEMRSGRFGDYLRCTGYPDCDGVKNIKKGTGVTCPLCSKGEIVEKKSKRGKIFFSCERYPDCTFALWQKPTGETCPQCKSLLVFAAKGMIRCSSKECDFTKEAADELV